MPSIASIFSIPRHERRRLYYWSGAICCVVGFILLIFLLTHRAVKNERGVPAFVGGYCAIFATVLSVFQILEHLSLFSDPECQTKIVRILFMVPLYAMISWFSILFPSAAEYLNLIRDAYESYAIYAFFSLMLALMGGVDTLYRSLMVEERPPIPHFFPLCWLEPVKVSPRFVQSCRRCLFQFMVIKPLVTFVILILTAQGSMGDSLFDVTKGTFWTTLIYNISITVAFSALVYFYRGTHEFLEGKNALPKFLCIKLVIFLSYWQGILIEIFSAANMLPKFDYWSEENVATGLQDLLICVEMLFVAFGHKFCFSSDEFAVEGYQSVGTGHSDSHHNHSNVQFGGSGTLPSSTGLAPPGALTTASPAAAVATIASPSGTPIGGLHVSQGKAAAIASLHVVDIPERDDESSASSTSSQQRFIPPIRMSISANLKYTLRHEDLWMDLKDIVRNR